MASPMKIRAQIQGSGAEIKILISHPMETGRRREAGGAVVPAHFIQHVTLSHNGKAVLTSQWGTAISANPFLSFTLKNAKKGDKITVQWVDNKNDTRTDEAIVG